MKLKKFLSFAIAAVLIIVSVISASAVEHVNTGSCYMNGYELYGSLTVYPVHANGHTYCEYTAAGKSAKTLFAYYNTDGDIETRQGGSATYDYTNKTSVSATTGSVDTSVFDAYAGAVTYSKVKYPAPYSHYSWSSDDTDTPLRLGCYR
jgi:hypothetical protein